MTGPKAVLTHGFPGPESTKAPVNRCGSYPEIAQQLIGFWEDWSNYSRFNQLSLAVPNNVGSMSYSDQLVLGTGSLPLKKSPYTDKDFVNLLAGAEFIQPLFDYASSYGYFPCRPMLRYLSPKQCLSYHVDDAHVRFHLVLSTHWEAFFVVNDIVYRMPEEGALYTLRVDEKHTAVNAHISKPRVHFTFTGYRGGL